QPVTTAVAGRTYTYPVKALDPDNDPLTYSLPIAPQGMAIDPTSGVITWDVSSDTPTFDFALAMGSSGRDEGRGVATDSLGNVYLTRFVSGTVDFDTGPGVANLTPAGQSVGYVAKYSPTGALIWLRSIQGSGNSACNAIAVDASDNVYVAGGFSGK